MEPELGELFEAYLNNIKTTYLEQSVSDMNSMDFDLLQDVNEAVERAILRYNGSREMFDLGSFRSTIQQICEHVKYVQMDGF
jgi:hypothetical protein